MPENSLRVVARIKASRDNVSAVRKLLSGLIEPTRKESGCVTYQLLQNRNESYRVSRRPNSLNQATSACS